MWRKEEVDAARHRQEKREATRLGKLVIAHGSVEFCEATPVWPSRRVEGILVQTRDGPRPA